MVLPGMIADISDKLVRLSVVMATLVSTRLLALLFAWRHAERGISDKE